MSTKVFELFHEQILKTFTNLEELTPASLTDIFIKSMVSASSSCVDKKKQEKKEEKKEEKKVLLPCNWSLGCTKKCLKVRMIQEKVYCSKHHQRMCDKLKISSSSPPPSKDLDKFDFSNTPPKDYKKTEHSEWWKFEDYSEDLLIHSPTNLVVSFKNLASFPTLIGLHENNELVLAEDLDICITSWVRLSNIFVCKKRYKTE